MRQDIQGCFALFIGELLADIFDLLRITLDKHAFSPLVLPPLLAKWEKLIEIKSIIVLLHIGVFKSSEIDRQIGSYFGRRLINWKLYKFP